jgi:hypothetical protein
MKRSVGGQRKRMTTKASVAVSLEEVRRAKEQQVTESPLYGVAMLKIAMELKKPDAGDLDTILSGVLQRMKLDESEFRAYLEANGGLLRTIAQRKKF